MFCCSTKAVHFVQFLPVVVWEGTVGEQKYEETHKSKTGQFFYWPQVALVKFPLSHKSVISSEGVKHAVTFLLTWSP